MEHNTPAASNEKPALADVATGSIATGATSMRRKAGRDWRTSASDVAIKFVFVCLLLAFWQASHYFLVTKGDWSPALFPAPAQVAEWLWDEGFGFSYFAGTYEPPPGAAKPHSYWDVLRQVDYPMAIWASILRLMEGYIISVIIGFPLGLMVARFTLAEKTIGWLSISLQALPSICWIPLAILWLGRLEAWPILFVTVMGSLFATVVAVADGIRNVPPLMARAGRTLGATGPRLYFSVLLPAAMPGIVTGLKIGWSFAWRSLMAAELIVPGGGLGFLLQRDRDLGDPEGVLATIMVIIVIGLTVQAIVFAPFERRLQALWGLSGTRS